MKHPRPGNAKLPLGEPDGRGILRREYSGFLPGKEYDFYRNKNGLLLVDETGILSEFEIGDFKKLLYKDQNRNVYIKL